MIVRTVIGFCLAGTLALVSQDSGQGQDDLLRERQRLLHLRERMQQGEAVSVEEIRGSWDGKSTTEPEVELAQERLLEVEQRFLDHLLTSSRATEESSPETVRSKQPVVTPESGAPVVEPSVEPTDPRAVPDPERLADLLYATKQYGRALEVYLSILTPGPEREPKILFWSARCLEHLDRRAEAIVLLQRLMNGYPESSWADQASWTLEFLERSGAVSAALDLPEGGEK
ncbi:MAG: hypothetical protein RL885_32070 [Planctomycetota bacterium]